MSFVERRTGGTDARLKCNQRVAAVGEGLDKKLERVGRDFRRRVLFLLAVSFVERRKGGTGVPG